MYDNQQLNFCFKNKLCVTNTFFQHPDQHHYTWQHPRSGKWHVLDYVLIQRELFLAGESLVGGEGGGEEERRSAWEGS
jgi:hypothetical protein